MTNSKLVPKNPKFPKKSKKIQKSLNFPKKPKFDKKRQILDNFGFLANLAFFETCGLFGQFWLYFGFFGKFWISCSLHRGYI
jgi:hypothetical protein